MITDLEGIAKLDQWLDDNVSDEYKAQPLAQDWARIAKVAEELGEAIQALIGYTGQNPRKGRYSSREEMLDEVADTLITCILGMQHFTKDAGITTEVINARWEYRKVKAGIA